MFLASLSGKKITSFLRHIRSSVDSPALPYCPQHDVGVGRVGTTEHKMCFDSP